METIQMPPVDQWMDKQNVVYLNGILFANIKKCSTDRCYNMGEPWKFGAEWKKPDTMYHILYDSIYLKWTE